MDSLCQAEGLAYRFRRSARGLALTVAAIGAAVLVGWLFGIEPLKRVITGANSMKPLTAIGFVLAGSALSIVAIGQAGPIASAIARSSALLVIAIGATTIAEYAFDVTFGIDMWFFADALLVDPAPHPGRMAAMAASAFVLSGMALWLMDVAAAARARRWLAVGVLLIGLVGLIGYLLDVPSSDAFAAPFSTVAIHTAAAFLLLAVGVLFARPDSGLVALMATSTPAGTMLRRVLPASIGLLLLVSWMDAAAVRAGLVRPVYGHALSLAGAIAMITAILGWTARVLREAERLRAEVEEQRGRWAAIVESSFDAMGSSTLDGVFTSWNRGAEQMFGYQAEEVVGRDTRMIVPADRRGELAGLLDRLRGGSSMESLETVRVRKDGTPIDVSMVVSPVRSSDGAITGLAVVTRDITARKAIDRLRADLVAMLSHDIKTPIAVILGYLELLRERLGPGFDEPDLVDRIERSAHNALHLAVDFVDTMKIESGSLEARLAPTSLNALVGDVCTNMAAQARLHGVTLSEARDPSDPHPPLDAALIERALGNLVSNAIKFSPRGGVVRVSSEIAGGSAKISVADRGPGIPEAERGRLFRRFEPLGSHRFGSSGLGLFIVKTIAEAHGGSVSCFCPAEGGSVFSVTLPLTPTVAARGAAA